MSIKIDADIANAISRWRKQPIYESLGFSGRVNLIFRETTASHQLWNVFTVGSYFNTRRAMIEQAVQNQESNYTKVAEGFALMGQLRAAKKGGL